MSNSEQRRTIPFLWGAILVLGALLAVAIFLLLRPDGSSSSDQNNEPGVAESPGEDGPDPDPDASESNDADSDSDAEEIPETGPLRAKLSDAVAGFRVDSWVESAGLLNVGAIEAYEGFYVQVAGSAGGQDDSGEEVEAPEPTLIAAGRWESPDAVAEWLADYAPEQAVIPSELLAEGNVPGVEDEVVGTYRYFESPDGTEAGVVWGNHDVGLLLVGEPEVVELLFTELPL